MLKEWINYHLTSCHKNYRRMGYLKELIATQMRANRIRPYWQAHLNNSRNIVTRSIARCKNKDKVVILGAGNLLDVPLEVLASNFKEVVLVDVVCLPQIRKHSEQYGNIKWLFHDVSGIVNPLFKMKKKQPLPQAAQYLPDEITDCDLVISLNLLSQLPCCPSKWLIKKGQTADVIKPWSQHIIQSHLHTLHQVKGNVCLITDLNHRYLNRKGELIQENAILKKDQLTEPDAEWVWPIAPIGEINSSIQMMSEVAAWINWK